MAQNKMAALTKARKAPVDTVAEIYRHMGRLFAEQEAADAANDPALADRLSSVMYAHEEVMLETPATGFEGAIRQLQVLTGILYNAGGSDNITLDDALFRRLMLAMVGTLRHALPLFPDVEGEPNYGRDFIEKDTGPFADFSKAAAKLGAVAK